MPTLTLTDEQAIELIEQLPVERQVNVLQKLNAGREAWWHRMATEGEEQMRQLCAERGIDWDRMNDEERLSFVDDLVHEDRPCMKSS
jgi:hypothetical protein